MALHLLAIMRLLRLTGEGLLAFGTISGFIVSLGGAAAAALVLVGWLCWDRPWYRWAVYWPWVVFLFTYVFLARHGETTARVFEAPLLFMPAAGLLLVALLARVRSDFKAVQP
jgi:hypothetical protein